MKEIMSNPTAGKTLINTMKDASGRWNGWSKMSNRTAHGVEIHYNAPRSRQRLRWRLSVMVTTFNYKL